MLCTVCAAQSDSVAASNEKIRIQYEQEQRNQEQDRRERERQIENIRRDRKQAKKDTDTESRISQLETDQDDAHFEFRRPTAEEIAAMQEKWKTEHPFTFSGEMPKFENQQIRVLRKTLSIIEQSSTTQKQHIVGPQNAPRSSYLPKSEDQFVMTPGAMAVSRDITRSAAKRGEQADALASERAELATEGLG